MAACVGTNLNNDGILLYEAMAVLFVAQAIGIDLDFGQQLLVAASCVIAGIGISGVPDAGLISLLIVLKTVKLPDRRRPTRSSRSCSDGRLGPGTVPVNDERRSATCWSPSARSARPADGRVDPEGGGRKRRELQPKK